MTQPSDLTTDKAADKADDDAMKPTSETRARNLSTEHQRTGDARRPSDTLDKGQPDAETIERKSSLID